MESFFRKLKLIVGVFLQVLLSLAVLLISWGMSTTDIDLSKCPRSAGVVSSLGTGDGRAFLISLKSVRTPYWLYRASGNYQSILDRVAADSAVTIYHSKSPDSHNCLTIYQLTDNKGIVYSKDEYERKEKLAGRFIGLPGGFILLGAIFYTTRKKIRQQKEGIEI